MNAAATTPTHAHRRQGETRISIVLPAYNEAGNLERLVREIFAVVPEELVGEVIVVDEGGGVMSNNLPKLPFTRVPRPVFPLDLD